MTREQVAAQKVAWSLLCSYLTPSQIASIKAAGYFLIESKIYSSICTNAYLEHQRLPATAGTRYYRIENVGEKLCFSDNPIVILSDRLGTPIGRYPYHCLYIESHSDGTLPNADKALALRNYLLFNELLALETSPVWDMAFLEAQRRNRIRNAAYYDY